MESQPESVFSREKWEKFDVIITRKDSRKASLFSAPGNLELETPGEVQETNGLNPNDVTKNGTNNGDITLLNNNGKAPKRRLSSYTTSATEKTGKAGRKRSSLISNGFGGGKGRKASTMTTDSLPNSSSNYDLVLVPENERRRVIPKVNSTSRTREQWGREVEFLLSVIGFAVDLGNVWRFPYICFRNGGDHGGNHVTVETGATDTSEENREGWGHKFEFLLAIIGFAVDLGNVWRFPYVCFRNGGGAFLIPYFLMVIFGGIPLFYLELILGQYHRTGCISIWKKVCPIFKGVGFGICLMALYVSSYYNTVIAWAVFYLFNSFTSMLPWTHCDPAWADSNCLDKINATLFNRSISNTSESPAHQFFENYLLELNQSSGIGDLGTIRWQIALCLILVYVIVYFALWKGVRSSGKVVWFTATFPYIVLIILLIKGVTLPGAEMGITYYLKPKWYLLKQPTVWLEAATQVFFSLGPGFGTLIALASYNRFDNNCYRDALITSVVNCFTSFLAGFVVFSVLGYMAHLLNKTDIEEVTTPGVGLLFVVFSQALTTFDGSVFFSIIFFLMIITLGLDSSFGGLEAVITGVADEYPKVIGKRRELFVFGLLLVSFLTALSTTTQGGIYLVTLMEYFATGVAIMTFVLVETVAISWCYGLDRLCGDTKAMLGFEPGIFWKICWKYVSPFFLLFMIFMGLITTQNLEYGSYKFPDWSTVLGWLITFSSVSFVLGYAIYRYFYEIGSPKQRLFAMLRPEEGGQAQPRESLAMTSVPE